MSEAHNRPRRKPRRTLSDRMRDLAHMSPERRRSLMFRGVAALAITVLVLIPGYLSSRPVFFQRYANTQAQYRTWTESVHAKVPCQSCHVSPGLVAQTEFGATMLGEFYISRVLRSREPKILGTPANAACERCHIDLRTVSPSGDLNIPHKAHVDILKVRCVKCHEFLVHELSPEGKHTPRMLLCLECHDGDQAKDACSTCHTQKSVPANHRKADWLIVHPDKQAELDCASCHAWTEDWCVECHSRRPVSHVAKWRSKHGAAVEQRRNCEACHAADFCVRCHGEVPKLNFDPALKLVE